MLHSVFGSFSTRSARTNYIMILSVAGLLLLCTIIYACIPGKSYTFYVEPPAGPENASFQPAEGDIVEVESAEVVNEETLAIEVRPVDAGHESLYIGEKDELPPDPSQISGTPAPEDPFIRHDLQVNRFGNIYDASTGNFTGSSWILLAVGLFLLACTIICFEEFRRKLVLDLYSYQTIFLIGFTLFLLGIALVLLIQWIGFLRHPQDAGMFEVLRTLSNAGYSYMIFTLPFQIGFAAAMTISNLALMMHEGKRLKNVIGMLTGLAMLGGSLIGFLLHQGYFKSRFQIRIYETVTSLYTSFFIYLECMLIGSIICAVLAAYRIPKADKDYLLILGCGFAPDGHLYPILRGRVDAAIRFWNFQQIKNGKKAILIPSGGQGPNECMAESAAMHRYLTGQKIPEDCILEEDQSHNTYENMAFSKALIDARGGGKAAFFTTNYHVFRSGLYSSRVGLNAEGMGSRTAWYFWPNAFVREFIGLMVHGARGQLLVLFSMMAFFAFATHILN